MKPTYVRRYCLPLCAVVLALGEACSSSGAGGTGGSGGTATTGGTTGAGGSGPGSGGSAATGGTVGSGGRGGTGAVGSGGSAGGSSGGTGGGGGGQTGTGGQGAMGGSGGTPLTCTGAPPTSTAFTADASGVTFNLTAGKQKVQVCAPDIIRVEYTSASAIPMKSSLSVSNPWTTPTPFCLTESAGVATITTTRMKVMVTESTGVVTYSDLAGTMLTSEVSKSLKAATVEGTATNTVAAAFNSPSTEALFGLGQQQQGVLNRKGQGNLQMSNGNGYIYIPFLVSNKGYGVFWDNPSITSFVGNASGNTQYSFSSETGDMVDYYFFYGPTIDQVIAGYRTTTGAAPMFPKWDYGLFQSKDHYGSTSEITAVEKGYRNNKIPVDVIVQDWDYWNPYVWGSHLMDPSRYADPAALVTQLHTDNIHTMISIWPLYQTRSPATPMVTGELDNFNALNAMNALYPDTGGGLYHFYDVFNAAARTLTYQQDYDRLIGKYGWDAIWADNDEPQGYPDGVNVHAATTAMGKGAFYVNAYPLEHTRGIYEGWRKVGPTGKRVYILSRSAFAGQQRYAAGCWSGDIQADTPTFINQIPGGLSFAISGMPYWTTDIGGYFGTPSEELFTRWFQFGGFCPTFRIHGQAPKELYGSQWSATGKANLLVVDNLRYRLMPYIYSLAWQVTSAGYTIMRPLVFDFQDDSKVYGIKDQYMFGPAFLVNPVTTMGATSRSVYLPAGTWFDFWTGSTTMGGTTATANAPLSKMPLYVRAGSIVPMGPMIQYATESIDPLEIRIYPGKDASFTLYEDEGDTYNYETGKYATIQFTWSDAAKQLTVGARSGSYMGMPTTRTFNVVVVGANHGNDITVVATPDKVVNYDGTQTSVTVP